MANVVPNGTIGPVRRGFVDEGKAWLGELMRSVGAQADLASALLSSGARVATGTTGLPAPEITKPSVVAGLESGGSGLVDSANQLPLVRMPNGVMSLQVDPRAIDAAGWVAPGAVALGRVVGGAAKQAGREFLEAGAKSGGQIWAGPKSKTWREGDAEAFRQRELADGDDLDPDYAWRSTGTARVKDGSLIQEIDDSGLTLKTDFAADKPLGEVVDHPKLFEAYPHLARDVKVEMDIDPNLGRSWGEFNSDTGRIKVYAKDATTARSIIAHELNHGVSRFEGRATGGSPDSAGRMVDSMLKDPTVPEPLRKRLREYAYRDHDAYQALQDEVLSRAVQRRLARDPKQNAQVAPELDYDTDPDKWIVSKPDEPGVWMAADGSGQGAVARVNIGLKRGRDGADYSPDEALAALRELGIDARRFKVVRDEGDTEDTLIAELSRVATPDEMERLSVRLGQEAIPQKVGDAGVLYGPKAAEWGGYQDNFFKDLNRLDPPAPESVADEVVATVKKRRRSKGQTVDNPQRTAFPEIYGHPVALAKQAESWVEPEDPMLRRLFGVGRADLASIADRAGNMPASLPGVTARGAGAEAAANVATRANARRLVSLLEAGRECAPGLTEGMKGWYVMDPLYRKFVEELGEEAGTAAFKRHITMTGMASPGSDVLTEINRGTTADMLAAQGRFDVFERYGGMPELHRDKLPREAQTLMGHPYHRTSQAVPMRRYLESGEMQMQSPKVPTYIESAMVPEVGFQTSTPVGDAHWARGVGLADTRGAATRKGQPIVPAGSVTNPEIKVLGPWYRDEVAAQAGLEAVPAQAIQWGLLGPQTGVDTALGAPKLELLAKQIAKTAAREGITPEQALINLIRKKGQAGEVEQALLKILAGAGATGAAAFPLLADDE